MIVPAWNRIGCACMHSCCKTLHGAKLSILNLFHACPYWRHDTQHNDTQHDDTQHDDTQPNDIQHIKK